MDSCATGAISQNVDSSSKAPEAIPLGTSEEAPVINGKAVEGVKVHQGAPSLGGVKGSIPASTISIDMATLVHLASSASLAGQQAGTKNLLTSPVPNALTKKEREKEKEEKERSKVEVKAKREEERLKKEQDKQLREKEKKEKQMKKEQELKERREKKEQEELEKKERKEKREAEKRKRDEEKQKKLDKKKKLEQEKEQHKEEKLWKEKEAKLKFRGYFGRSNKPRIKEDKVCSETILTPFSIKSGMSLAKASRKPLQNTAEFDQLISLQSSNSTSNYIHTCKLESRKMLKRKICPRNRPEDDVMIISDSKDRPGPKQDLPTFKLLQFSENHRPAYYGSWRRKDGSVTPRNPFKKGSLDYEVDSDEEWEEEEPGESLSSSEGEEKEGEPDGGEDSDEEDDGFFVPHGYLSNDEGDCSDSGEGIPGPDDDLQDNKRNKQLAKAKAWETEFARKCQRLEPKVIGCIWIQTRPGEEARTLSKAESFLMQFSAVALVPLPIPVPMSSKGESSTDKMETQGSCNNAESTKQAVPEEAMPDLIQFIHKSAFGVSKIIKTFRMHWGAKISASDSPLKVRPSRSPSQANSTFCPSIDIDMTPKNVDYESMSRISKRQLEKKIQWIAVKAIRAPISRQVWYVHDAVLKQYGFSQESITPLLPEGDGSPSLTAKPIGQKSFLTPGTPTNSKTSKRKSGRTGGKSLLDFLSRSPLNSKQAPSPPKRMKMDTSTSGAEGCDDVMIIEPRVKREVEPQADREVKVTVSTENSSTSCNVAIPAKTSMNHVIEKDCDLMVINEPQPKRLCLEESDHLSENSSAPCNVAITNEDQMMMCS